MSHLTMEELTDSERQAIDEAMRALDPYLLIAKVDWLLNEDVR